MSQDHTSYLEVIRAPQGRSFRFVLLDFDGTLSLIRQGWPDVMIPMMEEHFARLQTDLTGQQVHDMLAKDVLDLTGKQTIFQMTKFGQRVAQHGGIPLDPRQYKAEYDRRLLERIAHRRVALGDGSAAGDAFLLAGARDLLKALAGRELVLCLASGTDQSYVLEEARLLDIEKYFGRHIYGALEDYEQSSKKRVIERLIGLNNIHGGELLTFGDGFVEIENCKEVGGYAVGVASDEQLGGGRVDRWKRDRLLRAGADLIIPDYSELGALLGLLWGERP